MLYSPLFREGDTITMRDDLQLRMPVDVLYATEDFFDDHAGEFEVAQCDIQQCGKCGLVISELNGWMYPECDLGGSESFGFIDETTVEARRVMQFLQFHRH